MLYIRNCYELVDNQNNSQLETIEEEPNNEQHLQEVENLKDASKSEDKFYSNVSYNIIHKNMVLISLDTLKQKRSNLQNISRKKRQKKSAISLHSRAALEQEASLRLEKYLVGS